MYALIGMHIHDPVVKLLTRHSPISKLFVSRNHFTSHSKRFFPTRYNGDQKREDYVPGKRHMSSMTSAAEKVRPKWPPITSHNQIELFVTQLSEMERKTLKEVLTEMDDEKLVKDAEKTLTREQLLLIAYSSSIPFVGFGFLDNSIMIIAGDYIDFTIGKSLGISVMAAAAMGNMIADVAGISLAGYIESIASKLNISKPKLTPAQLASRSVRLSDYMGKALGIVVGCVLGMFPLFFLSKEEKEDK